MIAMFINLVVEDLNKVKQIIIDSIRSTNNNWLLDAINKYITVKHGKMIRPLLLLLFARIFNSNNKDHVILAAVIELIHIASLLHDDVLDNSKTRRHNQTINYKWGNQSAILAGNFLYTKAFELMQQIQHPNKLKIFSIVTNTTSLMIEGEILQLSAKYNFAITEENYLTIIKYKTAQLFIAAVQLPGLIAESNFIYNIDYLLDFGLNIGIYYQLTNDIQDYYKFGNDLAEGCITLPAIFVLNNLKHTNLINLIKNYANHINPAEQLTLIRHMICNYGGFKYTQDVAQQYITKAKNSLAALIQEIGIGKIKYQQAILKVLDELVLPSVEVKKTYVKNS